MAGTKEGAIIGKRKLMSPDGFASRWFAAALTGATAAHLIQVTVINAFPLFSSVVLFDFLSLSKVLR